MTLSPADIGLSPLYYRRVGPQSTGWQPMLQNDKLKFVGPGATPWLYGSAASGDAACAAPF